MLKNTLEVLAVALQLASNQPIIPSAEQYLQTKPQIYAQSSGDLNSRIREADSLAENKPISAIPLYERIVIDNAPGKEIAIERLFGMHHKIVKDAFAGNGNYDVNSVVRNALNFYERIDNNSNANLLAKGYLQLGSLLWKWNAPANFREAISILEKSYSKGSQSIKAEAAWNLALVYWNSSTGFPSKSGTIFIGQKSDAEKYFKLTTELAPNSEFGKYAKRILHNHFQKPK